MGTKASRKIIAISQLARDFRAWAFALLLMLYVHSCFAGAQRIYAQSAGLEVTISEFQVGVVPPKLNYNTCMNIWEDGRVHLERRLQAFPDRPAALVTSDFVLPDEQMTALQNILSERSIRNLPDKLPIEAPMARTWLRGWKAWIARGGTIQEVGSFEWGTPPSSSTVDDAPSMSAQWAALKRLRDWMDQIPVPPGPVNNSKPDFCGIDQKN